MIFLMLQINNIQNHYLSNLKESFNDIYNCLLKLLRKVWVTRSLSFTRAYSDPGWVLVSADVLWWWQSLARA